MSSHCGASGATIRGESIGPCAGPLQVHHWIKQQRIKRAFPRGAFRHSGAGWQPVPRGIEDFRELGTPGQLLPVDGILADPRNLIVLCWDHHQRLEGDYSALPPAVWEFAREFGLDAQLENDIARRAA